MQLILRAEQMPTELMERFVAEIVAVCKEPEIDVHPDAVAFQGKVHV